MPTNLLEKCPDSQTLVDFLLGKLPTDVIEDCRQHLANCDPCGDTIRGLKVDGDTIDDLSREAWLASVEANGKRTESQLIDDLMNRMEGLSAFDKLAPHSRASVTEDRAAEVQRLLSPSVREDDLGTLGKYRLRQLLGAGSTGVVYRAVDEDLDRTVAIKVLRPSLGELARERFIAEARATAKLQHPNVVQIFEVGMEGPLAFISMMWEPGQTLEQLLESEENLPVDDVKQLGVKLSYALDHAHQRGLIHRDIKPANIWIPDEQGMIACKILDFGLVRITDEDPQLTCTGMIAGTPCYMSPEQSRGQQLDGRSDLFSLGCVLFQALTGRLPFRSDNALSTLQSIQRDQPTDPVELDPSIPGDLSDLVMCLLEKSPNRRPPNAKSVGVALTTPRRQWPFDVVLSAPVKTKTNPEFKTPSRLWKYVAALLIGLGLGVLGLMFGPHITSIVTNHGTIEIESKVDDVKIEVLQNGQQIRVIDLATEQSVYIKSGNYEIRPMGDENSIQIANNVLTLTRGEKEIVTITRNPILPGEANRLPTSDNPLSKNIAAARPNVPYTLDSGDILGIFIEGVIGEFGTNPPVNFPPPGSGMRPSTGYPVLVDDDGKLDLPLIKPILVRGKTVIETKKLIVTAFEEGELPILKKGESRIIISLIQNRNYDPPVTASSTLRKRIVDAKIALANASKTFSSKHPTVQNLNEEVRILEQELARTTMPNTGVYENNPLDMAAKADRSTESKTTAATPGETPNRLNQLKANYQSQLALFEKERIDRATLEEAEAQLLEYQLGHSAAPLREMAEWMNRLLKIRESQHELAVFRRDEPVRPGDDSPKNDAEILNDIAEARAKLANARRQLSAFEQGNGLPSSLPVYDGETYEECLEIATTERDLSKILPALQGLASLAGENEKQEAAEAIMRIVRRGTPLEDPNLRNKFNDFKTRFFHSLNLNECLSLIFNEIANGNANSLRSLGSDRYSLSRRLQELEYAPENQLSTAQQFVDSIHDRYVNDDALEIKRTLLYVLSQYESGLYIRQADCSAFREIIGNNFQESIKAGRRFSEAYPVLVAKISPEVEGFDKRLQVEFENDNVENFDLLISTASSMPDEQAGKFVPIAVETWKRVDSKEFPSLNAARYFSRFPQQCAPFLKDFESILLKIQQNQSDYYTAYSELLEKIRATMDPADATEKK